MGKFLKPFLNIKKVKWLITVWLILIFFCGQLGIIFEAILNITSESQDAALHFLNNGSLYTFSIALLASGIFPFIHEIMNKRNNDLKTIKMLSIILGFGLIILMTLFFVALDGNVSKWEYICQILFYLLSLVFSIYYLCLDNLDLKDIKFSDLRDESLNDLYEKQSKITSDGEGNAI